MDRSPKKNTKDIEREKAFAQAVFPFEKAKIFKFVAINRQGKETKGYVRAKSREAAIKGLLDSGYTVRMVEETTVTPPKAAPIVLNPMAVKEAVTIFTRQLLVLYRAGIPLDRAVSILFVQTEEKHLKQALSAMYVDMVRGSSFQKALSKHPHVFPQDYIEMIKAGEKAGELAHVLEQIAILQEKNLSTMRKLQAALTYPFTVLFFTILVNYAVFKYILPNFVAIFRDLNLKLPLVTRIIVAIVDFMQTPWFWVATIGGLFSLGFFISRIITEPYLRRIIDSISLKIPWIGKLIRQVIFIRSFRVFATMLSSGVTVANALKSVAKVSKNHMYMTAFNNMVPLIEKGRSLPECFNREKSLFPLIVRQMIYVGDETGEPEIILNLLADFYEVEMDFALETITIFVEPLLMAIMGILVGVVVLAIFVPIYGMITTIS